MPSAPSATHLPHVYVGGHLSYTFELPKMREQGDGCNSVSYTLRINHGQPVHCTTGYRVQAAWGHLHLFPLSLPGLPEAASARSHIRTQQWYCPLSPKFCNLGHLSNAEHAFCTLQFWWLPVGDPHAMTHGCCCKFLAFPWCSHS